MSEVNFRLVHVYLIGEKSVRISSMFNISHHITTFFLHLGAVF